MIPRNKWIRSGHKTTDYVYIYACISFVLRSLFQKIMQKKKKVHSHTTSSVWIAFRYLTAGWHTWRGQLSVLVQLLPPAESSVALSDALQPGGSGISSPWLLLCYSVSSRVSAPPAARTQSGVISVCVWTWQGDLGPGRLHGDAGLAGWVALAGPGADVDAAVCRRAAGRFLRRPLLFLDHLLWGAPHGECI